MKKDLINFGRCGQIGAYALQWVGETREDIANPSPNWFVRNGLFILYKNLQNFNVFIIQQLYYNIMCELLCISRECFDLKEFEKESLFVKIKMDFEKTLFLCVDRFNSNRIKYALIGGFAEGLYGISRTTFDIDFIVDYDKEELKKIFSDFYKVFYENKCFLQFVSENKLYGGVEIILAQKELSKKIIEDAKEMRVFENRLGIKVARIEDIIGLKLK